MIKWERKKIGELFVSISFLFIFWIMLTFPSKPLSALGLKNFIEHILIGLFFSIIITIIIPHPLFTSLEIKKYFHFRVLVKLIIYLFNLFIAMIAAGIDVAYRVMGPKILIAPGIVEIDTPLKEDIEISLNANSITLTPGTITMDVEKTESGSCYYIHCISKESIENILITGGFVKKIQNILDKTK